MLEPLRPDVISPPAVVVAAFDQARAHREISAAVVRRDTAKGEYKSAIIEIGQKFAEARRAMPDVRHPYNGAVMFSPELVAFAQKCGFARNTLGRYMAFARDPARLEKLRREQKQFRVSRGSQRFRLLSEVRAMLAEATDKETALRVIDEEIRELAS